LLDLLAPIEPGQAAAGLAIGDAVSKLFQAGCSTSRKLADGLELLDFGSIRVWARGGIIDQIGVRGEYSGHLRGTTIGIGSTIQQVRDAIGPVLEDDEDNLIVSDLPGMCFETGTWRGGRTVEENLDAKLTDIFVFSCKTG
jgi:hypothetical protein